MNLWLMFGLLMLTALVIWAFLAFFFGPPDYRDDRSDEDQGQWFFDGQDWYRR